MCKYLLGEEIESSSLRGNVVTYTMTTAPTNLHFEIMTVREQQIAVIKLLLWIRSDDLTRNNGKVINVRLLSIKLTFSHLKI